MATELGAKTPIGSVAPCASLPEVVDDVERQREAEGQEDSDPPRGRVSHAVAVGVQEDRNRRAARDRPGENELGRRQLVSLRDRASSTAAFTPSGSGPVCFRQSSKRSSASVVRDSASARRPVESSFTDQS